MFDTTYFFDVALRLAPGIPMTFFIALFSFIVGGILGFIMALIRLYKIPVLNQIVILYISFFRGTPLLVQLFMFYYGIPIFFKSLGLDLDFGSVDAIYYALVVFSLYASGYLTEICLLIRHDNLSSIKTYYLATSFDDYPTKSFEFFYYANQKYCTCVNYYCP